MSDAEYEGREQSQFKHDFLKKYLSKLLFIILQSESANEFVYVDGFAGPWKSKSNTFDDTSAAIALQEMEKVRAHFFEKTGRRIAMKAIFVEEDPEAFGKLKLLVSSFPAIAVDAFQGRFEDYIDEISRRCGSAFSFAFIDPTGWTGFSREKLKKLLSRRGETIVNFMHDYINRFLSHPNDNVRGSFGGLFSDPEAVSVRAREIHDSAEKAEYLVDAYREELKTAGSYRYAAATCIYKPNADSPYFFLVFGTRHKKGLEVFRDVERSSSIFQEKIRTDLKRSNREQQTGHGDLLSKVEEVWPNKALNKIAASNAKRLELTLLDELRVNGLFMFSEILPRCLELRLISRSTVSATLQRLREKGLVEYDLPGRQRVVGDETIVRAGPKLNPS
jgi:three-Cys-motif partner protein